MDYVELRQGCPFRLNFWWQLEIALDLMKCDYIFNYLIIYML